MPTRSELQIRIFISAIGQSALGDMWLSIVATIINPAFGMIALFCAVGHG